jgi:hypothetical protein
VADQLVKGSFRSFTAVDMRDRNTERHGSRRRYENFVAISNDNHDVGLELRECGAEAGQSARHRLDYHGALVAVQSEIDCRCYTKPVARYLIYGVTMSLREMRARDDELQREVRLTLNVVGEPIEQAIIGAGAGDDAQLSARH